MVIIEKGHNLLLKIIMSKKDTINMYALTQDTLGNRGLTDTGKEATCGQNEKHPHMAKTSGQ